MNEEERLLQKKITALTPAQQQVLAMRLESLGHTTTRQDASSGAKDMRLVAYIVPHADEEPQPETLRNYLSQKLPAYMIPSHFITLDALPKTPNGKLDRQALPEPGDGKSAAQSAPRAVSAPNRPQNDGLEEQIARLWAELLGFGDFQTDDNFFELGGHSLLVTRMVAQLRDLYKIDLPVSAFFQSPTIAGLAQAIRAIQWAGKADAALEGEREEFEI